MSNQPVITSIPQGAKITATYLDPADPNELIVEYFYRNKYHSVSPERLDVNDYMTSGNNVIYLLDGITHNDVYEIISNRFNLGLVSGQDYVDNPTVIKKLGRLYLPISPYSMHYKPNILILDIVKKEMVFNGDEDDRNLEDIDVNPFTDTLFNKLRSISNRLIDGTKITCFNGNIPTLDFRNLIISQAANLDGDVINEVRSSYIISAFNDGVSDVVIMVGASEKPYPVRFISANGDAPSF